MQSQTNIEVIQYEKFETKCVGGGGVSTPGLKHFVLGSSVSAIIFVFCHVSKAK